MAVHIYPITSARQMFSYGRKVYIFPCLYDSIISLLRQSEAFAVTCTAYESSRERLLEWTWTNTCPVNIDYSVADVVGK